jgi:hypothetical protein
MEQRCVKCKHEKQTHEFKIKKDGKLTRFCLDCLENEKIKNKSNYEKNKEKRLNAARLYRMENKKKLWHIEIFNSPTFKE